MEISVILEENANIAYFQVTIIIDEINEAATLIEI